MNKRVVMTVIAAVLMGSFADASINVLPRPAELEEGNGSFTVTAGTQIVYDSPEAKQVAEYLQGQMQTAAGFKLDLKKGEEQKENSIALLTSGAPGKLGEEGYLFEAMPAGVLIRANGPQGLFYGVQTLRQLLPPEIMGNKAALDVEWSVPAVTIKDKPRFKWRGMHLDAGRHFFPVEDVKKYIDLLAFYKMNTFHFHLTEDQGWRIEIKKYPRLTEVGSIRAESPTHRNRQGDGTPYGPYFYTQEDIREIVEYAKNRFITVVPEIEMPGHSLAALAAYPELGCTGGPYKVRTRWGVEDDIYCAGKEKVFDFLEDVLDETMQLFPSEFIHIGGDEAPKKRWKNCPDCQARMEEEGLKNAHELQSYFIQRIGQYLSKHGRRLIGWDEILEGGLPPNAAVMSWRGTKGGIAAAKSGHNVVMTPTSHCYFDYYQSRDKQNEPEALGGYLPLKRVYSYEPIPAALTAEQAKHVIGTQGNVWTEYICDYPHVEYMACPRMIALSETVWSPKDAKDYSDFIGRIKPHLAHLDVAGVNYRQLDPQPVVVGEWKSGEPSENWEVRKWDITPHVGEAGRYRITFQYTGGSHRLDIQNAEVLINGKSVAKDMHWATTGARNENNTYTFDIPKIPQNASIILKSQIRSDAGRDSNGQILILKE